MKDAMLPAIAAPWLASLETWAIGMKIAGKGLLRSRMIAALVSAPRDPLGIEQVHADLVSGAYVASFADEGAGWAGEVCHFLRGV